MFLYRTPGNAETLARSSKEALGIRTEDTGSPPATASSRGNSGRRPHRRTCGRIPACYYVGNRHPQPASPTFPYPHTTC